MEEIKFENKYITGEGAAGVRVVQGGQDHPAPKLPIHADAARPLRHRSPQARPSGVLQVHLIIFYIMIRA